MVAIASRHGNWFPPEHAQDTHQSVAHNNSHLEPKHIVVAGVVIVGLGLLAWSLFAPELRRYIKNHSM